MARDILSEFGPDYRHSNVSKGSSGLTSGGGRPSVKSPNYHPPQGPLHKDKARPGIGEVEPRYGMDGERLHEPGETEFTGGPGIGGTNHGSKGSQGKY